MPQQSETRLLTGGINTDHDAFALGKDEVLNCVNLRILRHTTQQGAAADWIPGNTEVASVTALLPAGTNTLLGKCVDEGTGYLFLLLHNSNGNHIIIKYRESPSDAQVVFGSGMVSGGLGWTAGMFIDCEAADGYLYFADAVHDLRYISTADGYYSSASPITQAQLTLGQEPPAVPLQQIRTNPTGSSTIQFTPLQFAYRFINTDGHTSVLSPYSTTALPARKSAVASNADSGKGVSVLVPLEQLIPANWKRVELVARFLESNVYYVIKRWDSGISADVTAVNNHNSGSAQLSLVDWTGATLETLDQTAASKPFDLIPIAPARLRLAASRLLVANFTEGYDTPVVAPVVAITSSSFTPASPSPVTSYQPYIIIVNELNTRNWWFAIILRFGGKNYLLPKECATGYFFYDNNYLYPNIGGEPDPSGGSLPYTDSYAVAIKSSGVFNIPSLISSESLRELQESGDPGTGTTGPDLTGTYAITRKNIVAEANDLTGFQTENQGGNQNWYLMKWNAAGGFGATVGVEATPSEFGPSSESRAFPPGVRRYIGLQYYDEAMRQCGIQTLANFTPASYQIGSVSLLNKITVAMPTGTQAAIPDWADSFSVTISRADGAQRFGFFFGGIVKAMFKNADNNIVYRDPSELTNPAAGYSIYGIGIPIPKDFAYDFVQGDYVLFSPYATNNRAGIIGVHSGHIVIQYTNDGTMDDLCAGYSDHITISFTITGVGGGNVIAATWDAHMTNSTRAQQKTAFILFSGVNASLEQFEVAASGKILGSAGNKSFDNFYSTRTHSVSIYGDAHTQIRTSDSGGGTGLSMTTYEASNEQNLVWITDAGRPTPTDSVGQKRLLSAIRYSNTRIPGAFVNGYGSFDTNDIKTADITAGAITALALTTRGAQDGGQLLVLCEHGSFAALVGQQQITGADGKAAFTAALGVIGDFNALRGQWGCQSPRSVYSLEGKTWWVDAFKRAVIEFNESGAGEISLFKAKRLFEALLVGDAAQISACADTFTGNMLLSIPPVGVAPTSLSGFTAEPDISDAADGNVTTWLYDWGANDWGGGWRSGAEFLRVGTQLYGWKNGKLWKEFSGVNGSYYGVNYAALLAIPFTENFPAVKAPLALRLNADRSPFMTILKAGTGTAVTQPYIRKEGVQSAVVMRDRTGNGASDEAHWNAQSVNGRTLKGDTITVLLYWSGSAPINLRAATLSYKLSSGR